MQGTSSARHVPSSHRHRATAWTRDRGAQAGGGWRRRRAERGETPHQHQRILRPVTEHAGQVTETPRRCQRQVGQKRGEGNRTSDRRAGAMFASEPMASHAECTAQAAPRESDWGVPADAVWSSLWSPIDARGSSTATKSKRMAPPCCAARRCEKGAIWVEFPTGADHPLARNSDDELGSSKAAPQIRPCGSNRCSPAPWPVTSSPLAPVRARREPGRRQFPERRKRSRRCRPSRRRL